MPGCKMNPNYVDTITVFRKQDGAWVKTVLHNCFWKSKIENVQNGTEVNKVNTYTVRIPLQSAGKGFVIRNGDVAVLGECLDKITMKSPDTATEVLQRNKPNAFVVTAYTDNTSHLMDKHYRLGG
mgnify:CR=1 FL=1